VHQRSRSAGPAMLSADPARAVTPTRLGGGTRVLVEGPLAQPPEVPPHA